MSEVRAFDITIPRIDAAKLKRSLDILRKTLERGILSRGFNLGNPTSYQRTIARSWIQTRIAAAQRSLRAAEWHPDGSVRHVRVKAARDEIRRLRKLELRTL